MTPSTVTEVGRWGDSGGLEEGPQNPLNPGKETVEPGRPRTITPSPHPDWGVGRTGPWVSGSLVVSVGSGTVCDVVVPEAREGPGRVGDGHTLGVQRFRAPGREEFRPGSEEHSDSV